MGKPKKTNNQFLVELRDKHPNIEALDDYITSKTEMSFRCLVDGYEWTATPNRVLTAAVGCMKCGHKVVSTTKKRKSDVLFVNNREGFLGIDVSTPKFPDAVMLIDTDDWDQINMDNEINKVTASKPGNTIYAQTYINKKPTRIHRLLFPESEAVDHINHDGLDNRRINLRPCTIQNNCRNNRTRKGTVSGVTGVTFDDRYGTWAARLTVNNKPVHLGTYKTKEDAVKARTTAQEDIYGEFSYSELHDKFGD